MFHQGICLKVCIIVIAVDLFIQEWKSLVPPMTFLGTEDGLKRLLYAYLNDAGNRR